MNRNFFLGLLILILSATGICVAEIPNLVGNWTGSGPGYDEDLGYVDEADYSLNFSVTTQKDRIFNGDISYRVNGTEVVEGFAGAIGLDNKTIYIAEFNSGYDLGTIISKDEIEMIYIQDGDPTEVFAETLRRVAE
ncbi:MAG: hypothetical protein HPY61_08690 [Methanotrichaceae archaeon]|nr:hypothetical protein [Methanotrichaceae archaeon]